MSRRLFTSLPALMLLTLLSGCQSLPGRSGTTLAEAPSREMLLRYAPNWSASGKIALRHGKESTTASFVWEQKGDNYVINLFGPFGQGSTWIRRTSQGVTLENSKFGLQKAPSAELMMDHVFGWQVPISDLQYWIRGLVAPGSAAEVTEIAPDKWLLTLAQQGWQVEYEDPQRVRGWAVPGRIEARREGMQVVAVVTEWDLPPAPAVAGR